MLLKIRIVYIILDLGLNFGVAPSFRLKEKALKKLSECSG